MIHSNPKNAKSRVSQSKVCYFHTTHSCVLKLNKSYVCNFYVDNAFSALNSATAFGDSTPWTPTGALKWALGNHAVMLTCVARFVCLFFFFTLRKRFLITGAPDIPCPRAPWSKVTPLCFWPLGLQSIPSFLFNTLLYLKTNVGQIICLFVFFFSLCASAS